MTRAVTTWQREAGVCQCRPMGKPLEQGETDAAGVCDAAGCERRGRSSVAPGRDWVLKGSEERLSNNMLREQRLPPPRRLELSAEAPRRGCAAELLERAQGLPQQQAV